MKVLEARFHPRSKRSPLVVTLGRIVLRDREASIEPCKIASRALKPFEPVVLLSNLRSMVDRAVSDPDPWQRLAELRSDYWSFIEVRD